MPHLRSLLKPSIYAWKLRHLVEKYIGKKFPSYRGVFYCRPGHFYSPLIDISAPTEDKDFYRFDGEEYWESIELNEDKQKEYFLNLLKYFKEENFPKEQETSQRYYSNNNYFPLADAYTLSAIMQKEKPKKIIEIGSGFSSAVMLDTIDRLGVQIETTFIEPYPQRLLNLLSASSSEATILEAPCQEISLALFSDLDENDILFVDSSHVVKVGSDVSHIILRILPALKPGVIIHFHDIVYPHSYPIEWLLQGKAWNESLFLRAFLACNEKFKIFAFNSFAWKCFPEIFSGICPDLSQNSGGSIWIRKIENM